MLEPVPPKTVLITGGSRGIGAGMVELFAERGWTVLFTYGTSHDRATVVAERTGTTAIQSDVGDEQNILSLFSELDSKAIYLNALINNAGITGPKRRLSDVTLDVLVDVHRTNFIGPILMAREVTKRMSTLNGGTGGTIVNISSTAVNSGSPDQWIDYAALKGGLDVFTRGLAREVGKQGIRVNGVAPGYTMTDPDQVDEIEGRFDSMRHEVPLDRVGSVREVAEAAYWLCSEQSSYVTGTVIPAAGGR